MAKRARGTRSRPGQRPRLHRRTPLTPRLSSPVAPPSVSLTPQEEVRAAEIEAEIVADERQADRVGRSTRERATTTMATPRVRAGSIAVRAAEEYGYVSRDVRRIITVGGSLFIFLIGLWAVVQATGARPF
jgi:hypothetical protein